MKTEQALVEELARVTAERDEARAELETRKQALLDAVEDIEGLRKLRDIWFNRAKDFEAQVQRLESENTVLRVETRAEAQRVKHQSASPWVMQAYPEPSRLEIATILKAGWLSNPDADFENEDDSWWIEQADKLIKANRQ